VRKKLLKVTVLPLLASLKTGKTWQ